MNAEEILDKHLELRGWNKEVPKRSNLYNTLIDAINEALHQPPIVGRSEQFKCSCGENSWEYSKLHDSRRCMNCGLVQTNI